jgi:hypothetical protein
MYYALQNKNRKALKLINKAITLGYNDLKVLEKDDSFKNLRQKRKFKRLLEKVRQNQSS